MQERNSPYFWSVPAFLPSLAATLESAATTGYDGPVIGGWTSRGVLGMVAAVVAVAVVAGCAQPRTYAFRDTSGHDCVRTCDGDDCSFECDGPEPAPMAGCGMLRPCFTMTFFAEDPSTTVRVAAVCDSCCDGDSSAWWPEDCAPILCETLADCPVPEVECTGGRCVWTRPR
jgi:hypothetical protein